MAKLLPSCLLDCQVKPGNDGGGEVKSGISVPFIERLVLRGMKLFRVKES